MHAFLHDYKAELRAGCVKLANRQAGVASSLSLIRTYGAQLVFLSQDCELSLLLLVEIHLGYVGHGFEK